MRGPLVLPTYTRWLRALCLGAVTFAAAASCTSANDTESEVPAQLGAVQPEANGELVAENSACTQLTSAEAKARSNLKCDSVKRSCPDYIRPAGGEGCFEYDEGSITGCIKLFDTFASCDDFDARPCLVTAAACADAEGGSGGAAGDLGEGGSGAGGLAQSAAAGTSG